MVLVGAKGDVEAEEDEEVVEPFSKFLKRLVVRGNLFWTHDDHEIAGKVVRGEVQGVIPSAVRVLVNAVPGEFVIILLQEH